jgi:hypothetical protein
MVCHVGDKCERSEEEKMWTEYVTDGAINPIDAYTQRWRDRKMERNGNGETERWREMEMGREEDGEKGKWGERKMERNGNGERGRWREREIERSRNVRRGRASQEQASPDWQQRSLGSN